MKIQFVLPLALALSMPLFAQEQATETSAPTQEATTAPSNEQAAAPSTLQLAAPINGQVAVPNNEICLFASTPQGGVLYENIHRVKIAKKTYGSVSDLFPTLEEKVRGLGANAVIDYRGSQRFNILPWRIVRPVITGIAVKLANDNGLSCKAMGGKTFADIINED